MFNSISLIPLDVNDDLAITSILKSLEQFHIQTNQIFKKAKTRLSQCQNHINQFNQKIQILEQKLAYVKTSDNVPVFCSLSKYPSTKDLAIHDVVFDELSVYTPFAVQNYFDLFISPTTDNKPITKEKINNSLIKKKNYDYIFPTHNFIKINNFNASKNISKQKFLIHDSKTSKNIKNDEKVTYNTFNSLSNSFKSSLLEYCEFGSSFTADSFTYKPELGNLNDFNFPEIFPDLQGASHNIESKNTFDKKINNLEQNIDFNIDIDFSAKNSFYNQSFNSLNKTESILLKNDISNTHKELNNSLQNQTITATCNLLNLKSETSNDNTTEILNNDSFSYEINDLNNKNQIDYQNKLLPEITTLCCNIPPAPPPPPPPPPPFSQILKTSTLSSEITNNIAQGHADLMEAIRAAGGAKNAHLKKVENLETNDLQKKNKCKQDIETSDDLMTSLAKALELRRKGIAGETTKNYSNIKNKTATKTAVNDAFLRLREIIPAPFTKQNLNNNSYEIDDEDDEDKISDSDDWN